MSAGASVTSGGTRALAAFASRLEFAAIPRDVVEKAKLSLLDTLACIVQGSTLAPVRKLIDVVVAEGGNPAASIVGTAHRTSASQAALVNGASAHAFQLDEIHTGSTLHPGSVVVPALLALCDNAQLSGTEFIAAMVAGYEVGIRVGLAAEGGMFKRGYHNQGTTGAVAAAAAAARALKLDAQKTMHALGLGASQAAGLMAVQAGANAKAFHCGRAAQSGVYAALLARAGYTGIEDVLDVHYGGFFSTLVDSHAPAKLTDGLRERWHTLEVGYKLSPASNGSITAMATLGRIMREHRLGAADISSITAHVSTNTLEHCGWAFDPQSSSVLAAQMNLRYGLAAMALDRAATAAQYDESRIRRADIAAFLPKIEVAADERFDADAGLRLACRLEVRTRAGERHAGETLYRPGSAQDPISADHLRAKFRDCCSGVLTPEAITRCMRRIETLEQSDRVVLID